MSNGKHLRLCRAVRRVTGSAALIAAGYPALLRGRCLNWGATPQERVREMPGDSLLTEATVVSTRAVTINASADAVWPWLAQMGPGRGGAYTYDWIENLLGLGMHSADTILPEFQHPQIGDAQRLGRQGPVLRIATLEPARTLVLQSDDADWVWTFGLYPQGETTRLVSRNRINRRRRTLATAAFDVYVMEPGSLVMERKMLLGIKQRAEKLAHEQTTDASSTADVADDAVSRQR